MSQAQPESAEPVRKHRHPTDEEKYEIFLEASRGDVKVGDVLCKWNLHSTEQRIRETVRNRALHARPPSAIRYAPVPPPRLFFLRFAATSFSRIHNIG